VLWVCCIFTLVEDGQDLVKGVQAFDFVLFVLAGEHEFRTGKVLGKQEELRAGIGFYRKNGEDVADDKHVSLVAEICDKSVSR
jgi:hypothetical protein